MKLSYDYYANEINKKNIMAAHLSQNQFNHKNKKLCKTRRNEEKFKFLFHFKSKKIRNRQRARKTEFFFTSVENVHFRLIGLERIARSHSQEQHHIKTRSFYKEK